MDEWLTAARASISSGIIVGNMKKELCDWDAVFDRFSDVCDAATKVLSVDGLPTDVKNEMRQALNVAVYNISFSCYVEKKYHVAIDFLNQIDWEEYPLSYVLVGMCIAGVARESETHKEFDMIYKPLSALETHEREIYSEHLGEQDQMLLAEGYLNLSLAYRFGFNVARSLTSAKAVLMKGLERLQTEDAQKMLDSELSHYKTGLFGGLKYI